jgi:3-phytase
MKKTKAILIPLFFIAAVFASTTIYAQTAKATVGTGSSGKADGVGIWIHPDEPAKSLILGADPSKGIATFNLNGKLVEIKNFGRGGAGGVDVRYNFPLGGEKISIVVSGNNKQNLLRFFTVNPATRLLEEITGDSVSVGVKLYSCCLYYSSEKDKYYVFVTSREGLIEQYEIFDNGSGKVGAKLVREINIQDGAEKELSPKTEVCVADDEYGRVYISQEEECMIWSYGANPEDGNKRKLVENAKIAEGDNVEGLAIYHIGEKDGYLIASVQNSFKYKVYSRGENNEYIGTFDAISADSLKIESHDCIEITNLNLGEKFPGGFMVTQNANNACGRHYQVIPWSSIAELFDLKKDFDYDIRKTGSK